MGYLRDCKLIIHAVLSSPTTQAPAVVLRAEPRELTGLAHIVVIALICFVAIAAWAHNRMSAREMAAERHVLDERALQLKNRALLPGSALACMDAAAATIHDSCETSLFASPQTVAAAVTYVGTQFSLLAAAKKLEPGASDYSDILTRVRNGLERDRFGIVAHFVAARPGCRSDQCDLLGLLSDASRVKANLVERRFESNLKMHIAQWESASKLSAGASPLGSEATR